MTEQPPVPRDTIRTLIRANHILHYYHAVDGFGHVSVRHPTNPQRYILAGYKAPALVSAAHDLVTYNVSDSAPVDPDAPKGYSERFIHGEMYSRFESVNCVVHSHAPEVLPFAVIGTEEDSDAVRLRPVFHMAGFLGSEGAPVWDITKRYGEQSASGDRDLLVKTAPHGASLASAFSQLPNDFKTPKHTVTLMRRHGFTTWGPDVSTALYRTIYTMANAKAQLETMTLHNVVLSPSGDSGGSSHFSAVQARRIIDQMALQGDTAEDARAMNERTQDKAWPLWVREVEVNPLYRLEA